MRRLFLVTNLLSIGVAWFSASQIWASATISETGQLVSISGLDAYPQVTFLLLTGVLIVWLTRYLTSLFSKFLASAVAVLLAATSAPIWFESAAGSISILTPQIAKLTGVSDWLGQSELIELIVYNHLFSDTFILTLIFWFFSVLGLIWAPRASSKSDKLVTRIDNLPSW